MSPGARVAVLVLGALLVGMGLMLLPNGAGLGPMLVGLAVLLSLVFEGRYRKIGEDAQPASGGGWQPTGETFRDEESGHWVTVWYNAHSGERRYVPVEAPLG
ncbi:MAG: hypothetical protein KGN34_11305 [Sphingomonadales bacterium]|nr:hypothetical protein [Sphingomonadales bacterium]